MKNVRKISIALCGVLTAGCFAACNDAPYSKKTGMFAYVNESSSGKSVAPITITENGASAEITVCVNKTSDSDMRFRLVQDQAVLDTYNQKQSSDYVQLPAVMLDALAEVVVPAGEYNSAPVRIGIKAKPAEVPADIFALALRLESVDGKSGVTPTTSTYVLPTVTTNIYSLPRFRSTLGGPDLIADWDAESYPNGFTVEWRYQVSTFGTGSAGFVVFTNHAEGEANSDVYLVHWDTPSPNPAGFPRASRLQVDHKAHGGFYYQPGPVGLWTNVWNHVAVTYDGKVSRLYYNGKLEATYESDKVGTEFSGARWFLSGNAWRNTNLIFTEARIWSVARSETQIGNNITSVSPRAAGLEAYWTMTEDTYELVDGVHTWADRTGNGHTLRGNIAPEGWIENIKSSDTTTPWQ